MAEKQQKVLFFPFSVENFSKAFLSKLKSILLQIESGLRKMHFQIKGLKRHRQCCYVPFNKKLSLLLLEVFFFIIAFDQNRQTWVRNEPKLYSLIWRYLAFHKYFQKILCSWLIAVKFPFSFDKIFQQSHWNCRV